MYLAKCHIIYEIMKIAIKTSTGRGRYTLQAV